MLIKPKRISPSSQKKMYDTTDVQSIKKKPKREEKN